MSAGYYRKLSGDIYQCAVCSMPYSGGTARHMAKNCCRDKKPANELALRQANEILSNFIDLADPAGAFIDPIAEDANRTPFKRAPRRHFNQVNADPINGNYSRSKTNPAAILGRELITEEKNMTRWRSAQTREWAFRYLELRDGRQCILCGATNQPLEIDHADSNLHNNQPDNLSLLCPDCNKKLRPLTIAAHILTIKTARCKLSVCERKRESNQTELSRHIIDYSTGSTEMRANNYFEVTFRQYVIDQLNQYHEIDKKDSIAAGAEKCGCSTSTATRYLEKMTSVCGALIEYRNAAGRLVLALKPAPITARRAK